MRRLRKCTTRAILWDVVWPGSGGGYRDVVPGGHLFKVKSPKLLCNFEGSDKAEPPREFPWLLVFSMSSYLRSLPPEEPVKLAMPATAERIEALLQLIPASTGI